MIGRRGLSLRSWFDSRYRYKISSYRIVGDYTSLVRTRPRFDSGYLLVKEETIKETLKRLPGINDLLGRLFIHFNDDLSKILLDKEGSLIYHRLMIRVIAQREYDLGNYTSNGMNYKLNKDWEDILSEYGGTILLPLLR